LELSLKIDATAFKDGMDATVEKFDHAFKVAANMIASMMKQAMTEDIKGAGNFGEKYLQGLSVEVDGDTITTRLDGPGADLFEKGGTISGHPLLWLPISGTDAVGVQAKDYGDQLFSVNRKAGGVPLLFSVKDHAPKYFGVPSVTIPQKFHLAEIQNKVMENFEGIFKDALK
jgi:hypothetical protein